MGAEGAEPTRQRVTAAEGTANGSASARAWRFKSSAIVRPPSAASWRRLVEAVAYCMQPELHAGAAERTVGQTRASTVTARCSSTAGAVNGMRR